MPSIIRKGASATASALEFAAGALRRVAGDKDGGEAAQPPTPSQAKPAAKSLRKVKPKAAAKEAPAPSAAAAKPGPAPTTRTQIADPKAAKKVRSRQG